MDLVEREVPGWLMVQHKDKQRVREMQWFNSILVSRANMD